MASASDSGGDFSHRHIGIDDATERALLRCLGFDDMSSFIKEVVPGDILCADDALSHRHFSRACSEEEALALLARIARKNKVYRSFIGQGYYRSHTPAVIARNVLENPAWYTAYTPYQAEIAQGRLEALLNFQTMVAELNGMEIANASLLDEASAAAEAMIMCYRIHASERRSFFVDSDCFVQTIDVVRTRALYLGVEVEVGDVTQCDTSKHFACLLQYPGASGAVRDYRAFVEQAHRDECLVVVATDLLALCVLRPPGSWGADVCIGSAQRFGVPLGCGGPHAAYIATAEKYRRQLPGRIVGVSVDRHGHRAYCLVLQTREQHIRREKATSNICTAQTLLAVLASFYAVYHGPRGLLAIAGRVHRLCCVLAEGLGRMGFGLVCEHFFDTINLDSGMHTPEIIARARERKINLRVVDEHTLGISLDECTTANDVHDLWELFAPSAKAAVQLDVERLADTADKRIAEELRRSDDILPHPVFNRYHSETRLLRYMRALADKDLALDRTMIPLGSCTMKLNASCEMIPISWNEFADVHPFAPAEQLAGYRELVTDIEEMLCALTGYAGCSLQPNAGSQGEYAGLLAVRAYHGSRGDEQRTVCLIPLSAHGTNPATARMCGLEVVVVACDAGGNVDVTDLSRLVREVGDRLALIMLTYPSTHGVFEAHIREVCRLVHEAGGLVYVDGANLNAMVGLCLPAQFGGDVSHLNLHKTFCIPHGGGGPGVGPVMVGDVLKDFLPSHFTHRGDTTGRTQHDRTVGAVSAAQWGNAGILPISWMYLRMMGAAGLRRASQVAILNANYMARRLEDHYPVLYRGQKGWVAHECIIDLRGITKATGVQVEDVAKRLVDYQFHAPTVSFPVAGTMMIEPTESESREELDRFCDAMIAIRAEISAIERGDWSTQDNPLKNAPHTATELSANDWRHPYTREQAAWVGGGETGLKYYAPVGRVDHVHGDRNFACLRPSDDE